MNELEDFLRHAAKLRPARELPPTSSTPPTPPAAPKAERAPRESRPLEPPSDVAEGHPRWAELLLRSGGLQHALLVSEILRRPVERWDRNW